MLTTNNYEHARCFVFREIDLDGEIYFQHYKASDDSSNIELFKILSDAEHWLLVNAD